MMKSENCVPVIKALADPSRLELVRTLLGEETCSVQQLADELHSPTYRVSRQLHILREAGIITSEKSDRTLQNRIAPTFERKIGKERVLDLRATSSLILVTHNPAQAERVCDHTLTFGT